MQITAKIFQQQAKHRGNRVTREAGFVVYNPETGNNLDNRVFATEQDARDAIPAILARVTKQIQIHEEREAATEAMLAAATARPVDNRGTYRTVRSGAFGEGRVYDAQPGATHYDNGRGQFTVQIWDND